MDAGRIRAAGRFVGAAVAALALAASCGTGADDKNTAAEPTTMTERETTSTTIDPVVAWCAIDWAEVERQTDDPMTDSREALEHMLEVAERGAELDHPDIPAATADIIDAITWPDRLADDPTTPAPDPAALSDAIIMIGFACDEAAGS